MSNTIRSGARYAYTHTASKQIYQYTCSLSGGTEICDSTVEPPSLGTVVLGVGGVPFFEVQEGREEGYQDDLGPTHPPQW